jgi:DNA helicase IV
MVLARDRVADPEAVVWSMEDVPLLDEAGELLGPATDEAQARLARQQRQARQHELDFANRVLSSMELDIAINAERFAERFADQSGDTIAEQAAKDRTWKFGHVIVDEAQELSPMAWRMLFRRNPNRSMTVVGDLAQCSANWAPASWGEILEGFAADRWRVAELTVNYRTPTEIMESANAVLRLAAPDVSPTVAIRSSGISPYRRWIQAATRATDVAAMAEAELRELGEGRLCVIAPAPRLGELASALSEQLGDRFDQQNPLGAQVALLAVAEAKGLEFDGVVIVEPGEIVASSARGWNDLYVALTRATQRLVVLYAGLLPAVLEEYLAEG